MPQFDVTPVLWHACHGRSNARAIQSAIRRASEFSAARLDRKIHDKIAELHNQEERLLGGPQEVSAG